MEPADHVAHLLRLAVQANARAVALKRQATGYVLEAHSCGASWADVGAAFGITRQAAHERFHGVNRGSSSAVRLRTQSVDSLSARSET